MPPVFTKNSVPRTRIELIREKCSFTRLRMRSPSGSTPQAVAVSAIRSAEEPVMLPLLLRVCLFGDFPAVGRAPGPPDGQPDGVGDELDMAVGEGDVDP